MKVYQFIANLEPGGALRVAQVLHQHLGSNPEGNRLVALQEQRRDGQPTSRRTLFRRARQSARAWLSTLATLRNESPDVILCHSPRTALFVQTAAAVAGVKRRVTVQHASTDQLTPATIWLDWLAGTLGIHTDIVFVGHAVCRTFPQRGRAYRRRSTVIWNGVSVPDGPDGAVVPAPAQRHRALDVVGVGRLDQNKNHEVLIRASAATASPVRLTLLGDGPERKQLAALAKELRVDVMMPGQVATAEVQAALRRADVFAFPSKSEAMPLALMEAAASGSAVVASDIAANREVMATSARYCQADDPHAWTATLDRLAADPESVAELRRRSRSRAHLFQQDVMIRHYRELLRPVPR